MSYPQLRDVLQTAFNDINATNDVASPQALWNDHAAAIRPLIGTEMESNFVALGEVPGATGPEEVWLPNALEAARVLRRLRQRMSADDAGHDLVGRMRAAVQLRNRPRYDRLIADLISSGGDIGEIARLAPANIEAFSSFQVDGWTRVLNAISNLENLLIIAPTGSGKTEVFLLPIIHSIARGLTNSSPQGRFVLLYPRVPLLKDQLARVLRYVWATDQRDNLNGQLIIGFQFGGVGANAEQTLQNRDVFDNGTFRVVERCPVCRQGELRVQRRNKSGVTPLACNSCEARWSTSIAKNDHNLCHPHLLVTTAESLDQFTLNPAPPFEDYLRTLTGIGFDEVHLYHSLYGVHISQLLRRLEELRGGDPLVKIGASATVSNPGNFAAKLFEGNATGSVPVHDARESPYDADSEPVGLEVVFFLQSPEGERVPGSNSTLIQTIMGAGHAVLSRDPAPPSELDKERAIVFTQSLDTVGRLSAQMNDAENVRGGGLYRFRTVQSEIALPSDTSVQGSAQLVGCPQTDPLRCTQIYHAGECWRGLLGGRNCWQEVPKLRVDPLDVRKVSAQERTNFWNGDILIATPVLEVGVDDDRIKSTIHYLPPNSVFSFIQRRGRAGRGANSTAYTLMVLGNTPSDQFYFFRRNRLINGGFELPLNPSNPRVRQLHDRLMIERNRMGQFMQQSGRTEIPRGVWSWVWDKLTSCPMLRGYYQPDFLAQQGAPWQDQKQWTKGWVQQELKKLQNTLGLRNLLRQLEEEMPAELGAVAEAALQAVDGFLQNGNPTAAEVGQRLRAVGRGIADIIYDEPPPEPELSDRLDIASNRTKDLWYALQQQTSGPSLEDTQRLHDFFVSFRRLFESDWVLLFPPGSLKIVLQAMFYLHLGTDDNPNELSCPSRMEFYTPDSYFQNVRPVVIEKRRFAQVGGVAQSDDGPMQTVGLEQEEISRLSTTLLPYMTAYRYHGAFLSTLDTRNVGMPQIMPNSGGRQIKRVTVKLNEPEGVSRGDEFEAHKVGVRALSTDDGGMQLVKMCPGCLRVFGLSRSRPCHDGLITVKLRLSPVVQRGYTAQDFTRITPNISRLDRMNGRTTILGSDVSYKRYMPNESGGWKPISRDEEFEARYDRALRYEFPSKGLRWNLSSIVSLLLEDQELAAALQDANIEERKDLNADLVVHTAAHLLVRAMSAISGVNEELLEYVCEADVREAVVWERFEGGAGLTEVVVNALQSDPMRVYSEMLASVLCPIQLAETTPSTGFDALRAELSQRWRLPADGEFLNDLLSDVQAEQASQSQTATDERPVCSKHDGCPTCVHMTYCTCRREQTSRVSRLVAEAILSACVQRSATREEVESQMVQAMSAGPSLVPPRVLWADQAGEEYDVLVF